MILEGAGVPGHGSVTDSPSPEPEKVLAYLKKHPDSQSEDICAELGADTAALRSVLHQLHDEGRISVQGKARATRYSAR